MTTRARHQPDSLINLIALIIVFGLTFGFLVSADNPTRAVSLHQVYPQPAVYPGPKQHDVDCSTDDLIAAITNANANPDTLIILTLGAGCTYSLERAAHVDDTHGDTALPRISGNITIEGNGATIERSNDVTAQFRIFRVAGGTLRLNDLTIANGLVAQGYGGAILNEDGDVVLSDTTVRDSTAQEGGGIYNSSSADTFGNLDLIDSTIRGNTAHDKGAGIFNAGGTLNVTSSDIIANAAIRLSSEGGGLYNESGTARLVESTFSDNSATHRGGGLANGVRGFVDLLEVQVKNNGSGRGYSHGKGGGLYNEGTMQLALVTVDGNIASGNNNGSTGGAGGGIYNTIASRMDIRYSTISANTAEGSGRYQGTGGGLYNGGTLTITSTAIINNAALNGTSHGGQGGGIYNTLQNSRVELINSTVSGNRAESSRLGGEGGGLYNNDGTITLIHATIASNEAGGDGEGGGLYNGRNITMQNSIIAANRATQGGADCFNLQEITSEGYNLVQDVDVSDCNFIPAEGDQTGVDSQLGDLADNDGPTLTHALADESVARDKIPPQHCPLDVDQRGMQRPQNSQCDIGAYEAGGRAALPTLSIEGGISVTEGDAGETVVQVPVRLSSITPMNVTVSYTVTDETATRANKDYAAEDGTLEFAPNTLEETINITVMGDIRQEPDETLAIELAKPADTAATLADGASTATVTITNDDEPAKATIGGTVDDEHGEPLSGETIAVNGIETTTDDDGHFTVEVPTSDRYIVNVSRPGYAPVSHILYKPDETLQITPQPVETFPITHAISQTVEDRRGTEITLPPNALVDEEGNAATTPVQVQMYTYDLETETMPGDMTGIDSAGNTVGLVSAGVFYAEFTDEDGEAYNLAPGTLAEISVPVDPSTVMSDTIPLWYYDETAGVWREDGFATLQGDRFVGSVSHFSLWNFDYQFSNTACMKIEVDESIPLNPPITANVMVAPSTQPRKAGLPFRDRLNALFNMPPYTDITIQITSGYPDIIGSYTVNTGAAWTTGGIAPPHPYAVCNGNLTLNAPGKIKFSQPTYIVDEGADTGTARIPVERVGGSQGEVSVACNTIAAATNSADIGDDYLDTTQVITFTDRDFAPKICEVPIIDDEITEIAETLTLSLTVVSGDATLTAPEEAVVTIKDNDPFSVNSTGEGSDTNPGDGLCDTGETTSSGEPECTLRAAIEEANAFPDHQEIELLPLNMPDDLCANPYDYETRYTLEDGQIEITDDLTIQGDSANRVIIESSDSDPERVLNIAAGVTATIADVTILGGEADEGAGIYNQGNLTLSSATIRHNTADGNGGGLYNSGTLHVVNSTIQNNRSDGGDGGGIYNATGGTMTILNSTIVHNRARSSGGGIANNGSIPNITNATISRNRAGSGGGIANLNPANGTVNIRNTILADNSQTRILDIESECSGPLTSGGHNLIGYHGLFSCWPVGGVMDRLEIHPKKVVHAPYYNGSSTQTMGLQSRTPARDAIPPALCPATDQRGVPRPQHGACDIGAYETQVVRTLIDNASGGVLEADNGRVRVEFLPNAVPDSAVPPVDQFVDQYEVVYTEFSGDQLTGSIYQFELQALSVGRWPRTPITNFIEPVTLEIRYTDEDVIKAGAQCADLTVAYNVYPDEPWDDLLVVEESEEDDVNLIVAETPHFTIFGMVPRGAVAPESCQRSTVAMSGVGMKHQNPQSIIIPPNALASTLQLGGASPKPPFLSAEFNFADGSTTTMNEPTRIDGGMSESETVPDESEWIIGYSFETHGKPGRVVVSTEERHSTTEALVSYATVPNDHLFISMFDTTLDYTWGGNEDIAATDAAELVLTLPDALPAQADIQVNAAVMSKAPQLGHDQRIAVLSAEAGGVSEAVIITNPLQPSVNISSLTLSNVVTGTQEVTVKLTSPAPAEGQSQWSNPQAGDSVFLLGASVNIQCSSDFQVGNLWKRDRDHFNDDNNDNDEATPEAIRTR